jgi:DNA helicase HerA-like ATPase
VPALPLPTVGNVTQTAENQTVENESGASSADGRTFRVHGLPRLGVPGDLVVLHTEDGAMAVGQLLSAQVEHGVLVRTGSIIGRLGSDGTVDVGATAPFVDASIAPAEREVWAALERKRKADMSIGTSRAGRAVLASSAFNRHTFMCGQSGSGKSYTLGVLLEQLLIDTELPLVVLDPNGDFVGLGDVLAAAEEADRRRMESLEVRVFRRRPGEGQRALRARFMTLSLEAKASVLQLDPLADRAEYHVLLELSDRLTARPPDEVVSELLTSGAPDERFLAQRIENLGVLRWDVWAMQDRSLLEELEPVPRAAVLDLGGFEHPREPLVVALELLDHLWARRARHEPVLLVIDEAHNICPATPTDPLVEATTARVVQLANEGRKYGIWLLLCSQRPSRIHESVLAQCDNLAMMRMNAPGDLDRLERVFGFAPPEMLRAAPGFRQGECLMAGTFAAVPTFVQVRGRRTREGGSDVRVPRLGEA